VHLLIRDQLLHSRPADLRNLPRQKYIQPLSRMLRLDNEFPHRHVERL
jgi:hypothetical protein